MITCAEVNDFCRSEFLPKLMKFSEICADVLVPKFTAAEVRLPGVNNWDTKSIKAKSLNVFAMHLIILTGYHHGPTVDDKIVNHFRRHFD